MNTRLATCEDCFALGPVLRQADKDEIQASSGSDPTGALFLGWRESEVCYTIVDADQPLAMFGVVRMASNPSIGQVWLLGTEGIKMHSIEFLRKSREWVSRLHEEFPVLYNDIDSRNTVHIRWLQWLGFKFINELPSYGYEGRLFYHFVRIKDHV
jgi:hypothetical protein